MPKAATPIYPDFDATGCTFLATVVGMNHQFDLYVHQSVVEGLNEILAVPAEHEQRGPICMEASLCETYTPGHPLHTGWLLCKAQDLL